ncbi:MAG: ABC transporter ATP-binding protein [Alphaproteobacteria bacterium]
MTSLLLEGVSHAFDGLTVVDGVNLTVEEGEIICLVGPSGCGKTTLLRIAAGLEELQEGRVVIGGREVAGPKGVVPPEERGVGLVFQDYALFPHLTVAGNVAFGLSRLPAAERRQAALDMLERVGMAHFAASYPHILSGGEQQRVALARALAPRPRLMLLDEPFSGLDVRLRDQIRDQTLKVLREAQASTLLVTHDPEEGMYMAHRIAVMRAGRIEQVGAPEAVYHEPANAFVTRFLSEVNCVHGMVEKSAVASPFGTVAARGIADGTRVDVLIRPEALGLRDSADREGAAAVVAARHVTGPYSVVVLRLEADGTEVKARFAGHDAPAVGSQVRIALTSDDLFIFPCAVPNK